MHHPPEAPTSRLRRGTAALAAAALAAGGLAMLPGVAAADAPAPQSITNPGSHNVIVPAGIDKVTVVADGAEGGAWPSGGQPGGKGGRVTATIAVSPGETLVVNVGGEGGMTAQAGYNGGGFGAIGGGGGATDVRQGGADLANRVVVAGGGGGSGAPGPGMGGGKGGDGGAVATAGETAPPPDGGAEGQPGTTVAGGVGGPVGPRHDGGTDGTAGQGGDGGTHMDYGGGGGGGFYGGGGGAGGYIWGGGGGGGGSSWASPTATSVSFADGSHSGDGQVTLTWITTPPTTTTAPTTTAPPAKPAPPKAAACPTNPYKVTPGLVWVTKVLTAFCHYVTVDIRNATGNSHSTWAISTVWLAGLEKGSCPTAKRIRIQPNHELIALIIGIACPYGRQDTKVGGRSVSYLVRR